MALKGNRYAADPHEWMTFRDDAGRVPLDRTNARIALPRHWNAVHKRGAGSCNDLAAVTGRVTESNHAVHVLPSAIDELSYG